MCSSSSLKNKNPETIKNNKKLKNFLLCRPPLYIPNNTHSLKMGAGIVLPRERIIEIARRELDRVFIEYDATRRLVDDNGFLLPESFDREEEYRDNIRYLRHMLRKIE
jgi:hypothetical protein